MQDVYSVLASVHWVTPCECLVALIAATGLVLVHSYSIDIGGSGRRGVCVVFRVVEYATLIPTSIYVFGRAAVYVTLSVVACVDPDIVQVHQPPSIDSSSGSHPRVLSPSFTWKLAFITYLWVCFILYSQVKRSLSRDSTS